MTFAKVNYLCDRAGRRGGWISGADLVRRARQAMARARKAAPRKHMRMRRRQASPRCMYCPFVLAFIGQLDHGLGAWPVLIRISAQ